MSDSEYGLRLRLSLRVLSQGPNPMCSRFHAVDYTLLVPIEYTNEDCDSPSRRVRQRWAIAVQERPISRLNRGV